MFKNALYSLSQINTTGSRNRETSLQLNLKKSPLRFSVLFCFKGTENLEAVPKRSRCSTFTSTISSDSTSTLSFWGRMGESSQLQTAPYRAGGIVGTLFGARTCPRLVNLRAGFGTVSCIFVSIYIFLHEHD